MCNSKCLSFIERYLKPEDISGKSILEIGSFDFNGSPRYYVEKHNPKKYLGIDIVSGKGVDEICDVQSIVERYGKESYDIVICMEVIEHILDWKNAIEKMKTVLTKNGKLIITTRSPGFPIHGWPDDYWRFTKENFREIFSDMENVIIEDDPENGILFYGIKGEKMKDISDIKLEKPFPFDLVLGHCSFIPHTGYAAHSREFFTRLNNFITTRIRNFAHTPDLSHLTETQKKMIIHQTWNDKPYQVGLPFNRDYYHKIINIILMETNHYYFYDKYDGPKIAYNVWESTRQPEHFFQKLLEFDQLWVPTQWQRLCSIDQGYPADRVKVVREGVNGDYYKPGPVLKELPIFEDGKFKFLLCGRWDNRKSTTEIIRAFLNEFKLNEPVEIICQVENPFPVDNYKTTDERLEGYKLRDPRVRIITGLPEDDDLYLSYLRGCDCLVTCARAEGWNLPLIQGLAVGIPTISSDWGAQLEFAQGHSHLVKIKDFKKPINVFMQNDVPGVWSEPDYEHLQEIMRYIYENSKECKKRALASSQIIREEFSWNKPVEVAVKLLEEFGNKQASVKTVKIDIPKKIIPVDKLNLGCGDFKKEGYINADKFNSNADINFDARKFPYDDEQFSEIYSSHMLEHFSRHEVMKVINECYRTLKWGGKLVLDVPDLEWVVKNWLNKPEKDRWEFPIDTIFGLQTNDGEEHRYGFTKESLRKHLSDAGFKEIMIKNHWSHDQECIYAEAVKRQYKDIFIVDTYPNIPEKVNLTIEMIEKIKARGYPVLLVSHYPVAIEIQEMVDYYIYDSNNIMSTGWNLNYWFQNDEIKVVSQYETPYHGAACYSSMYNAMKYLKSMPYEWAHFVEFDIDVDLDLYLETVDNNKEHRKFIGFMYDEEQNTNPYSPTEPTYGVIANLFSFDIEWSNYTFEQISSWDDYKKLGERSANANNIRLDLIYENWLHSFLRTKLTKSEWTLFTKNDLKYKIIRDRNLFDQGKKEPEERKFLSETDDGKAVELVINTKTRKWSHLIRDKVEGEDYTKTNFKFKDDRIRCIRWNPFDNKGWLEEEDNIRITFNDGVKAEIIGTSNNSYNVRFIDKDTGVSVHKSDLKSNTWAKPYARYYTNWRVEIDRNGKPYVKKDIDLVNSSVMVYLDSKALGDTVAWFPYAEKFQEVHGCKNFYVSTYWNNIFKSSYPNMKFIDPILKQCDIFYTVGCRDNDYNSNKNNWRLVPLQQVATDYLGLNYEEIKPKIVGEKRETKVPYVTISEHSTLLCKRWLHPNGWQAVVNHIRDKGYGVMVVSKEKSELKRVNFQTDRPIEETINNIYNSRLFIGVGSGLSWLAWGLGVPVTLISGFSEPWAEMKDCIRITAPEGACSGCYNDIKLPYDRGNWTWCPRNKKYECSRLIQPSTVIEAIDRILK